MSEAITWLAYGKPRGRSALRRIERRRPVAFSYIRAAMDATFASLLPKLMEGAAAASGVLVHEYGWDAPPDAFHLPQAIDPAHFAPGMAFRYGADSIDLPPDGADDGDEKTAIWLRAAASDAGSYRAFVNVTVDAAALLRAFPPSPKTGKNPELGARPGRTTAVVRAEVGAVAWLRDYVAAGRPRLTRKEAFDALRAAGFKLLTERGFLDRVWGEAAPDAWRTPGAPKKRPQ